MTAGADGTTIDGMSDERIQRIIESMRDKSYLPKPARKIKRPFIPAEPSKACLYCEEK